MSKFLIKPFPCLFHFKLILVTLLLSHATSQLHANQAAEQAVLIKLKRFWQNPSSVKHWTPSLNSSSHCSWPEITCLNNSITELSLRNYSIDKTIPSFLCDLENLKHIDLFYNNIPGGFPRTIYNCSKLEYLDLSQNFFVGTIPDDIYSLHQLRYLNLNGNNFSGEIPASIGRLQELRTLMLSVNHFNGSFPHEIGNLSQLEVLELAYNAQLLSSTLPPSFRKLKKMKTLWLTQTNLIGKIPEMIGDFTALEVLDLSINELTGKIPSSLFLLKALNKISLFQNQLSGEIPQVIQASNLAMIDLSENNLIGTIPRDIGKLESLSSLVLYSNQLSGEIPESIGRISTLTDVRLFNNSLSGPLPPDFGRYSMLEGIEVASNWLTGSLPEHLCDGGKLLGLVAFSNNLTGALPESLGNCSSLIMLNIHNNSLSGRVPTALWTSTNLSMLMLSDNSFTGELPEKVSPSLSRLEISNNKFYGQILIEVNSWKNMDVFKASNNLFNSTFPESLTALPSLTVLLLVQNQLHGSLPSTIISWKSLVVLNLSQNKLSGQIPEELGVVPTLTDLDLSRNQFSGTIPPKLGLQKLISLNLSSNLLTGNIPKQFENAAFSDSFLDNPGLCASSRYLNLETCPLHKRTSISFRANQIWITCTVIGIILLITIICFFLIKLYQKRNPVHASKWEFTMFQNWNFTSLDILRGLVAKNEIGSGGSGIVYRVELSPSDGVNKHNSLVAAKVIRFRKLGHVIEAHFQAEVGTLGTIRHLNIVKLIGCIWNDTSKVLVYEYLENRSLDLWLYKHQPETVSILDWPKRLHIAVGAAQGLCYMHHDCSPPIIHRDVKSSNILLDSDFNAKIADFGLAKMLNKKGGELVTVSEAAGTFGYMAPEYGQTRRINEKIDVYSFGVILLELTTGRQAINGDENRSLAEWAQYYFQDNNSIVDALDMDIKDACYLDQMCNVFKIGLHCTQTSPSRRPCMRKVLQMLLKSSHCSCVEDKNDEEIFEIRKIEESKLIECSYDVDLVV